MIEGTKPYRGREAAEKYGAESPTTNAAGPESSSAEETARTRGTIPAPDATNLAEKTRAASTDPEAEASLGRREWFRSLVPVLGDGLVKLLRTSNNLKRDLTGWNDPSL